MPLLELTDCTIRFGGLTAVSHLSIRLEPGELLGLIGPNGAGKTTVFNIITGVYRPNQGQIRFDGRSLVGLKPHQIAGLGIARTFQNIRLFPNLTVLDNVRAACRPPGPYPLPQALLHTRHWAAREYQVTRRSLALLRALGLSHRKRQIARNLPYGEQRRLEIARALATSPRLLLLDEPTAGMNPQETQALMSLILSLRDRFSLTILLIEHDMRVIMGICQRVLVLDYGVAIAEGTPESIRTNPAVIEAYLGEAA